MATRLALRCAVAAALLAAPVAAASASTLTFDDLTVGDTPAVYQGVAITGGTVAAYEPSEPITLNPNFPPESNPNVLINSGGGPITFSFANAVDTVSGYVTGNVAVTLEAYAGAVLLGSVSTGGPNYIGVGTPNELLSLSFAGQITSVIFRAATASTRATFTVDNVTAVPEPGTWALMLGGFGLIGGSMRMARRKKKLALAAAA